MPPPKPESFFTGRALELARSVAAPDLAAVRALAPQTDLNAPGDRGMTELMFALMWASGLEPERLAVLTELVRAGANAHLAVPDLGSPFDATLSAEKSPEFLRALLEGGVSPNARAGRGEIPGLFPAASQATVANMKLLLDRGADVNARDKVGTPVITYALRTMQLDQVEELLERGADPSAVNRLGQSFGGVLEQLMARQLPDSLALQKMIEIRDRIVRAGVAWPPAPAEAERERMRERGEEPIVPLGHTR